jgi:hypothetical protein
MNNLLYSRNILAVYFSSLVLPDLVIDHLKVENSNEYFQIIDAGERDSMMQVVIQPSTGSEYYILGGNGQDATTYIFTFVCNMSMWVKLI